MDKNQPPVPPSGRPKKGFWGFIASLFPKRPAVLEPPTPKSDVPRDPKSDPSPGSK